MIGNLLASHCEMFNTVATLCSSRLIATPGLDQMGIFGDPSLIRRILWREMDWTFFTKFWVNESARALLLRNTEIFYDQS